MITQQQAAELLLRRRSAVESLVEWSRLCGYEPAKHHRLIIDHLEAVSRGEIRRLAIFVPPGSAKSTYSSVLFPPWFLAQRGGRQSILCASHNEKLATKFGGKCRDLIDEHGKVLTYSLCKDSQAKDDWATSNGSVYFCAGVGGRIAGHRADLGLIDDPIGSIQDADSETVRDATWDWYEWNFLPRLKPNSSLVVISTRWHEDDLMGRLLAKEPTRWTVIKIPMEADENDILGRQPGERLWPEYFTEDMVTEAKANPRKWQGAYQQDPSPKHGSFFEADWLVGYQPHQLPSTLTNYCASDHACSEKELTKNDPNLFVPFGTDEGNNIWIYPDVWWKRGDTGKAVRAMLEIMHRRQPLAWVAESEHITKSIKPFLLEKMYEENLYIHLEEFHGGKNKTSKAGAIQGMMEMRKVFFPTFAEWWPAARHELLTFPVGVHDEWPDVLGVIGRFLRKIIRPQEPKKEVLVKEFTMGWLKKQDRRHRLREQLIKEGVN